MQDLFSPSSRKTYDLIIIGQGKRAKTMHHKVCIGLQEKNTSFRFATIPNRTFLAMKNLDFKAKIWVVVVPPKYRLAVYLKILKSSLFQEKTILAETPSGTLDIIFSMIPFLKMRIAEAASINDVNIKSQSPGLDFAYTDNRFGEDHSYAVYFRYMGTISGICQLLLCRVSLNRKKNDNLGVKVSRFHKERVFLQSPEQRITNELNKLFDLYENLIANRACDVLCYPLQNLLLKKCFRLLAKRI